MFNLPYIKSRMPFFIRFIHPLMNEVTRRLLTIGKSKPVMTYFEVHLTDHCNLNCKGCSHFSPLADEYYADIEQYKKDILRMRQMFHNIRRIRLLGGEPLLHKDFLLFIQETRKLFPLSRIELVTNGILINSLCSDTLKSIRETGVVISITNYPPISKKLYEVKDVLSRNRIPLVEIKCRKLRRFMNMNGDSNKVKVFRRCTLRMNCTNLRNGYLYPCPVAAYIDIFNKKFSMSVHKDGAIDIYKEKNGFDILKKIKKPLEKCRWCSSAYQYHDWSVSNKKISEWAVKSG